MLVFEQPDDPGAVLEGALWIDTDAAPVTGPVGPQGPAGSQGPAGPAGPAGQAGGALPLKVVTANYTTPGNEAIFIPSTATGNIYITLPPTGTPKDCVVQIITAYPGGGPGAGTYVNVQTPGSDKIQMWNYSAGSTWISSYSTYWYQYDGVSLWYQTSSDTQGKIPSSGNPGQVLQKKSSNSYDTQWAQMSATMATNNVAYPGANTTVIADNTTKAFNVNLPAAPMDGSFITVFVGQGANAITVVPGSGDTLTDSNQNVVGTYNLSAGRCVTWVYAGPGKKWWVTANR
jgi:hypothetical protein